MFWFLPVIFGSLLAGGIATSLVALVITLFIDEETIADEIRGRKEFQDAFKALIKSKNTRTVNVDIFNYNNNSIGSLELTSDKGVSDNLYVGQTIYL